MISIVLCSRREDIPEQLKENIRQTAGVEYEIVCIGNPDGRYSIFQAYNEGVRRAKGELICFMHDDVLFRTEGWVDTIASHFQAHGDVGLIGFAGTHFLSSAALYWMDSPFISEHNLTNDHGTVIECFHENYFEPESPLADVVAVDGFCFFVRRELFSQIRFDDQTYTGFHAYDMDICMQVLQAGYRVAVCRDIVTEHFWSEKDAASKAGYELLEKNLELFARKWQARLPLSRGIYLPEHAMRRLDGLCLRAYDARKARRSRAYRTGSALLAPAKRIQAMLKHKKQ